MNSKDIALVSLYENLLSKFGSEPETKQIILTQINLIKQKPKLTVLEIENLESNIKARRLSKLLTSPNQSSKPENSAKPTQTPAIKHSPLHSFRLQNALSLLPQKKTLPFQTSPIFPSESPISALNSSEFWRKYSSLSPSNNYDVWAQIQKADYIKHKQEEKAKSQQKQISKLEYKAYLDQQVLAARQFKDLQSYQNSLATPSWLKDQNKDFKIKQDLDELVFQKSVRHQKTQKMQTEEDERFIEELKKEEQKELRKKIENKKKYKELSLELRRETESKHCSLLKEAIEEREKSRQLLNGRKSLMEKTEKNQKAERLNKILSVQDDSRIQKMMPPGKTLTKEEGLSSLQLGEPDRDRKQKQKENQKELIRQMNERKEKQNEDLKEKLKENEKIRKDEKAALKELEELKSQKKSQKFEMKNELDKQVSFKAKQQANQLLFTDTEARLNKKIFESSLEILAKTKINKI